MMSDNTGPAQRDASWTSPHKQHNVFTSPEIPDGLMEEPIWMHYAVECNAARYGRCHPKEEKHMLYVN